MNRIFLILACLTTTLIFSQAKESNQDDPISKDYMKIVFEQCANPDIIEVEIGSDGYVEVEYLCEGKRYEIGIKNNVLLFSEHRVSLTEIPFEIIKPKIEKIYQGWILDELSQITVNDTSFIKIEILKDGIEHNLYFTNDGKWFKIKPIDVSSTFDSKAIEQNAMYKSATYNFHKPDSIYLMPDVLKEISGIALSKEKTVYSVQDEIGSIFEYDLNMRKISNFHRFTDVGDFEGIAINKNTIYVLRSDGNIFVYDLEKKNKTYQVMLHTNSLDVEGICFKDGYLYVACKDALINQHESKRMIYRAKPNKLNKLEPYLEVNIHELSAFLSKNYAELEITKFHFKPSAIAIHPITKDLYLLSASDRFLAIYKHKKLINVIPLSPEIYYKPEGLSFFENGDLLISSEGDKKGFIKGTINLIKYK